MLNILYIPSRRRDLLSISFFTIKGRFIRLVSESNTEISNLDLVDAALESP